MPSFEKVNPSHPDKVADRIAGAIVDLAYKREPEPKVAVEVLLGHGNCNIIVESSQSFKQTDIRPIVDRIVDDEEKPKLHLVSVQQDVHLAENQNREERRCGDNGIFKGSPVTELQRKLTAIAKFTYSRFPFDGKYIITQTGALARGMVPQLEATICQSHMSVEQQKELAKDIMALGINELLSINPLGEWTGGISVDSGATNRKLGSDMGDGVTGGGLHGKDYSKPDVSVNIVCFLLAQKLNKDIYAEVSIGDLYVYFYDKERTQVGCMGFDKVIRVAKDYISGIGGFEKFAEWGLIR